MDVLPSNFTTPPVQFGKPEPLLSTTLLKRVPFLSYSLTVFPSCEVILTEPSLLITTFSPLFTFKDAPPSNFTAPFVQFGKPEPLLSTTV